MPDAFDCRATAAVLRSGSGVALAGHFAALMTVLLMRPAWMTCCSIVVWCAVVYLAIRVKIDVHFFELLAEHHPEQLDHWLHNAGLRKSTRPKTLQDRRRGALRLWRALVAAVAIQIVLLLLLLLA